jgi:hypothetical protein
LRWKRCWFGLVALVLVVPGGMVLDFLLKIAFHRHRPNFEDSFLIFHGYSFPSGHTMVATLLYGVLAAFAVSALESWRWRVGAVLGAFVMVLLIGFSRMYLGAHYLSDVLGAAAAGLAWLALSLTAVDALRRSRPRNMSVGTRADCGEIDFPNTLSDGGQNDGTLLGTEGTEMTDERQDAPQHNLQANQAGNAGDCTPNAHPSLPWRRLGLFFATTASASFVLN